MKEYVGRVRRNLNEWAENNLPGDRLWSHPIKLKDFRGLYEGRPEVNMINLISAINASIGITLPDFWFVYFGAVVPTAFVNGALTAAYSMTKKHYMFDKETQRWIRTD